MNRVPILDLSPEMALLGAQYQDAFRRVMESGQFIQGPETKAFEGEVATYLGVKHAIGLNSGTDALVIGLRALGIGPGDEVITSGFTFFATAEAISLVGATPVFADICEASWNLDPRDVERKITPRTRALLPVHIFGQGADMAALGALAQTHRLPVLEDVAQAFGAHFEGRKLGTLGEMGTFSFFPSKNLGALGDGGLLATDRDDLARLARMLANHGSEKRYHNEMMGYNSRLDSVQAALLRIKLTHVDEWNEGRRRVAARYSHFFSGQKGIQCPTVAPNRDHVFHQYTLRIEGGKRDAVQSRLNDEGISTMIYYPFPVPKLKAYGWDVSLPVTEQVCAEVLSLPIWPQMEESLQARVAESVVTAVRSL